MTVPERAPSLPDGYFLQTFDDLDGTNAEALRAGCPPGLVVVANRQTAGRGRGDRLWQSPPGNLYATVCVGDIEPLVAGQLSFVAGLAVLDAVSELASGVGFSLKWPNDVMANGRKVSGILIEAGDAGGYAVGIGINLTTSPPDAEVRHPATSIAETAGIAPPPAEAVSSLCRHFDAWYRRWRADGFEPLRAVWLASAHGIGDTIAASTGDRRLEGRFEGLDANGSLILVDGRGTRHSIAAGDVFFPATG